MQLNSDTSKKELEDIVRSVLGCGYPAPNGGPLGRETELEYKTRLFNWVVNVTSQLQETAELQETRDWCLAHSVPSRKKKNSIYTVLFTKNGI